MSWLRPEPEWLPAIPSLERFLRDGNGTRLVFNIGGWWQRFPAYSSAREYASAVDLLVRGALLALGPAGAPLMVVSDPFGTKWIEWLLPMQHWMPAAEPDPDWPAGVSHFAQLYLEGVLPPDYAGPCASDEPAAALRCCCDMVIRNLAPVSWLVSPRRGWPAVLGERHCPGAHRIFRQPTCNTLSRRSSATANRRRCGSSAIGGGGVPWRMLLFCRPVRMSGQACSTRPVARSKSFGCS